ncbi:RHS repeat domain-containing protein, partial [Vibrio metschnikovii]|uniref:RHS repeat domain-containing protein n=1 Tax=Vibrio metschnikovii TaxID=28172 RepID=UPI001C30D25D
MSYKLYPNSSFTDTLGHQWTFRHSDEGQLLEKQSPEGRLWRSEPEGSVTHYQYDKFGRLIQSQSEHGEQCQWWWNEAEQLI